MEEKKRKKKKTRNEYNKGEWEQIRDKRKLIKKGKKATGKEKLLLKECEQRREEEE